MPCSGCSALHGVNPNIKKIIWRFVMKKKKKKKKKEKKEGDSKKKRIYSKMWENAVWVGLIKILWDSPCVMVLWKLLAPVGSNFGWDRVAHLLQRCQWLLLPLLSSRSYYRLQVTAITGCVYVCLEKRKDSGLKQVLGICLVEATKWKCVDDGAGSCCWTFMLEW